MSKSFSGEKKKEQKYVKMLSAEIFTQSVKY